jgi:hypothetical protein
MYSVLKEVALNTTAPLKVPADAELRTTSDVPVKVNVYAEPALFPMTPENTRLLLCGPKEVKVVVPATVVVPGNVKAPVFVAS